MDSCQASDKSIILPWIAAASTKFAVARGVKCLAQGNSKSVVVFVMLCTSRERM